jgi:hypothetical protein
MPWDAIRPMTAIGASRPLRRIPAIVSFLNPQETFLTASPDEPLRRKADDQVPCDRAVTLVDRRNSHPAGAFRICRFGGSC